MFDDIGIAEEVDIESYCQIKTIFKPSFGYFIATFFFKLLEGVQAQCSYFRCGVMHVLWQYKKKLST